MGRIFLDLDPHTEQKLQMTARMAGMSPQQWLMNLIRETTAVSFAPEVSWAPPTQARPYLPTPREAGEAAPAPPPPEEEPAPEEEAVAQEVAPSQAEALQQASEEGAPLCET